MIDPVFLRWVHLNGPWTGVEELESDWLLWKHKVQNGVLEHEDRLEAWCSGCSSMEQVLSMASVTDRPLGSAQTLLRTGLG